MGIVTIVMALVAWGFSAAFLWLEAGWIFGAIECALIAIGLLASSFIYCTHCPLHRKGCMHLFVGMPARLCKDRCSEPYTAFHDIATMIPLAAVVLFPQYWLIASIPAFVAYWLLLILTIVLILTRVCPVCGNELCGIKKLVRPRKN